MRIFILNMLNCCIEYTVLLVFWSSLNSKPVKPWNYVVTFLGGVCCSVIASFIDSFLFSVLPINFLMIFAFFLIGFRETTVKNVFWNIFISYSLLIFLQVVAISVTPITLLGSQLFNFIGNGCVLAVAGLFYIISGKLRFKDYYSKNQGQVRLFFIILCIPEMITAQFFASVLSTTNKIIVLLVLLLQLLYATALLLAFSIINRKNERQQYANTIRHMDTLNDVLNSFKRDTHDFNKHIRYLQNIVETRTEEEKVAELREEVTAYCKDLLEYSHEKELLLQLGDPTFRALLYGRRSQAEQKGIRFFIEASAVLPDFPVKTYQLVEIFDNLIDNAFECVETLSDNRWIRVILHHEQTEDGKGIHILCIQNPYETLDFETLVNQSDYTSKGGSHRGIGLHKVEMLVSASGGRLILGHDEQIFSVKIQYTD